MNKNAFLFEAWKEDYYTGSIAYCFGDWANEYFSKLRIHGFKNLFHYSLLSYGYTILYRVNRGTIYTIIGK